MARRGAKDFSSERVRARVRAILGTLGHAAFAEVVSTACHTCGLCTVVQVLLMLSALGPQRIGSK